MVFSDEFESFKIRVATSIITDLIEDAPEYENDAVLIKKMMKNAKKAVNRKLGKFIGKLKKEKLASSKISAKASKK